MFIFCRHTTSNPLLTRRCLKWIMCGQGITNNNGVIPNSHESLMYCWRLNLFPVQGAKHTIKTEGEPAGPIVCFKFSCQYVAYSYGRRSTTA